MTRRQGEVSRADLMRKWPHHIALSADKVRGTNTATVYGYAETLTDAPRPYFRRRGGDDLVVFCFAKPEDAQAFAEHFGGERLPYTAAMTAPLVRNEPIAPIRNRPLRPALVTARDLDGTRTWVTTS